MEEKSWAGYVARMSRRRMRAGFSLKKSEVKRSKHWWENNIKCILESSTRQCGLD